MFERRLYYHVDWALIAAVLALCIIGVIQITGLTENDSRESEHRVLRTAVRAERFRTDRVLRRRRPGR